MNTTLIPGARYRLTFEGVATAAGALRTIEPSGRLGRALLVSQVANAASVEKLSDPAPIWHPGDVVLVKFHTAGKPYTYVRGARGWPGEEGRPRTDEEISEQWRAGLVTPLLQSGGVPFNPNRIPDRTPARSALDEALDDLTGRSREW